MDKKLGIAGLALAGLLICMLLIAGCTSGTGGKTTPTATPVTTTAVTTTVVPTVIKTPVATSTQVPATVAPTTTSTAAAPSFDASGTIKVTGSTTVLPIAQAAADAYQKLNPNAVNIQVTGGGSGVGVQSIGEKTVNIGMSSRDVTADEMKKYPDFVITPVALDALSLIVNAKANPVDNLTLTQIQSIYNGTITNWKQVGGNDMPITVIGRDSASGSRTFFTDTVMKGKGYIQTMLEKNSNGAVEQSVSQTPGAIGYTGLGFTDPTIKQLKIDVNGTHIAPSVATVLDKSYPLSRKLYMITNGQPTGLTKDYINFILSKDGQEIVEDQGFVQLP